MKVYFPYKKERAEQSLFVRDVAECLAAGNTILANAPTGLGKTVSSISPALAYALKTGKKVFFLTPKSSQHEIALETANLMNEKFNLGIKTVDLVGKKKMCIHPLISHVGTGFYEACAGAKKNDQCAFYLNTKGKTKKQISEAKKRKEKTRKYGINYADIKEACSMEELCPYELTIDMIKDADLVIADYFHIFNDEIRKTILGQAGLELKDCILIIDEAHNLPERIRDMLSTTLRVEDLEKAAKEAKEMKAIEIEEVLKIIAEEITSLVVKIPFGKNESIIEEKQLSVLKRIAKANLVAVEETAGLFMHKHNKEKSFLLAIAVFLHRLASEKKHTLHLAEKKRNSLRISLYPLDPSEVTARVFAEAHSSVLMSGTLSPLKMYADVLGITKYEMNDYASPFPQKNRLNIIVNKTTTKYSERNQAQYEKIALTIEEITSKVPGNSIIFFPSFELIKHISPLLRIPRTVLKQERNMKQNDKTRIVKEFKELGTAFGGVLLAVSGGSMAEGIDFPGDNLKCAVIVGIPFAQVSLKSKALIEFYDKKFAKGWDYGYNAPAISRAVQAAGRVIRSEKDRGVCIFLDTRFTEEKYRKFFPTDFTATTTKEPEKLVDEFF